MSRTSRSNSGFSLIELLLVLAILFIIAGIAIPSFLGQRRRARLIGDARANASVIQMHLEQRRADNGLYGTNGTYEWTDGVPTATAAALIPSFTPKGNSKMNYTLEITGGGLTYSLTVKDATLAGTPAAWISDQAGNGQIAPGYK